MPYEITANGCSEGKPFAVRGPDGKVLGCHATRASARRQQRALYANTDDTKEHHIIDMPEHADHPVVEGADEVALSEGDLHIKTPIKRENGMDFPPRDYAYVPDPLRPATWRLRLTETPGKISAVQLQRAAAAISSTGYRGNRLEIPPAAATSVKRRLLAEFRRLKVGENDIPASVKAVGENDDFMTWKDANGHIRWFSVYSNNFRDEDIPPEIISERSQKSFVDLVDSGLVDYPELWLWHIRGTAWGKADWVAYSDGFAMAAGYVYPGFEHVAERIAQRKDLLVSHGMPNPLLIYDPRYKHVTIFHVTYEISVLPDWAAANKITGFAILGKGDVTMTLPKEKKAFLTESGLSEDVVDRIEENLRKARQLARDAGIESKEKSAGDPDDADEEDVEDVGDDEDWDGEENADDEEELEMTTTVKAGNHGSSGASHPRRRKRDDDDEDDKGNHGSSGASKPRRRRKPSPGKGNHGSSGASKKEATVDVAYVTRDEVAEAIADVMSPILQNLNAIVNTMETMSKEISALRADDEERLAVTKEVTPTLSLSDIISQRIIGKEAARVHGNSTLGKEGPVETPYVPVNRATMVPFINELQEQSFNPRKSA